MLQTGGTRGLEEDTWEDVISRQEWQELWDEERSYERQWDTSEVWPDPTGVASGTGKHCDAWSNFRGGREV